MSSQGVARSLSAHFSQSQAAVARGRSKASQGSIPLTYGATSAREEALQEEVQELRAIVAADEKRIDLREKTIKVRDRTIAKLQRKVGTLQRKTDALAKKVAGRGGAHASAKPFKPMASQTFSKVKQTQKKETPQGIRDWSAAVKKARQALGVTTFRPVAKGSRLYAKAREFFEQRR
mmetsp:Transcript_110112/g.206425  ORF Transcript_110112/g.206425 Transcript_110112/m.206425 type:complete len:177 (-) Transcript_110112:65-595(-)